MSINSNLKKLRKKKGLTQEEFAALVGISLTTVKRWEWGETSPTTAILPKLAEVLDTTMDYLIEEHVEKGESDEENVFPKVVNSGRNFSLDSRAGRLYFKDGERVVDLPDTPENQNLYWRVVEKMLSVRNVPVPA